MSVRYYADVPNIQEILIKFVKKKTPFAILVASFQGATLLAPEETHANAISGSELLRPAAV